MLKEQQTPRSVGKGAKMAEHGTATPFHSQYFSTGTQLIKLFSSEKFKVNFYLKTSLSSFFG
jgi:hypothetical protein